jgi:alpha-tubulin suppressor-like RCC1 family protein
MRPRRRQLAAGATAVLAIVPACWAGGDCTAVAGGDQHSLALRVDGTVLAWGLNGQGRLGDGTIINSTLPVRVRDPSGSGFLSEVSAIAEGWNFSVALRADGTVWAWGGNFQGELGNGTGASSRLPVQVKDGLGFLSSVVSISAGGYTTLALKSDGTVWAWGDNAFGQLGNGTNVDSNLAVQVMDTGGSGVLAGVTAVSSGATFSLALKVDGTVWAWGHNPNGELGNGTFTASNLPVQVRVSTGVFLSGISGIAAGAWHSLALASDATVWAWGLNDFGQAGTGDPAPSRLTYARQVKDSSGTGLLSEVASIAAGAQHSMARTEDRRVWSWGVNVQGQLGNGTTVESSLPVQVRDVSGSGILSGIAAIARGGNYGLALKDDGTVVAWGYNLSGQLGNGTSVSSALPVHVRDPDGQLDLDLGSCSCSVIARLEGSPPIPVCAGSTVALDATASTLAGCSGPGLFQFEEGASILRPFEPDPRFDVAVLVERTFHVRVACSTEPSCEGGADLLVPLRDDTAPGDQGNLVRAVRRGEDVELRFDGAPASVWRLYRDADKRTSGTTALTPDVGIPRFTDPGAVANAQPAFYRVKGLSPCTLTPGP